MNTVKLRLKKHRKPKQTVIQNKSIIQQAGISLLDNIKYMKSKRSPIKVNS
jgi:hypothetical protein